MEIGFTRAQSENQTVQRTAPRQSGEAVVPRRSWNWRQWLKMMTSRKMDLEGLYESA